MLQSILMLFFSWSEQVNWEITTQQKEVLLTISQADALTKKENNSVTRNLFVPASVIKG